MLACQTGFDSTCDIKRLRGLALSAQGLSRSNTFGAGLAGARKAINHIGYVQIDTIFVVERAHHHVMYGRVPGYKSGMLDQMLLDRDIFEYWTHAAAFIPIEDYRFSLPYKHAIKSGQTHWNKNPDKKLMKALMAQIRSDGPLRSRDLEGNAKKRAGWWDWKPTKKALEQLYMQGDLMVSRREGFQKVYDLTERVLPSHINLQMPGMEEFAAHLIDQQLRCHGLVSRKGFTYLRRNAELRRSVKTLIDERLAEGELQQVRVDNGEVFILKAGVLEEPLPRLNQRMHILSPFDNAVIQRERLKTLFDYEYQLECYVPSDKRQYGYFSLPLLYQTEFVGSMDCKVHRKLHQLEIKTLHLKQHTIDEEKLIDAFVKAVDSFRHFQHCHTVVLNQVYPVRLRQPLRSALKTLV